MTLTFIPKRNASRPYMLGTKQVSLTEAADTLGVGLATVLRHVVGDRINAAAIEALVISTPRRAEPVHTAAPLSFRPSKPARLNTLRMYECGGMTLTVAQWAEKTGFSRALIHQRIEVYGWDIERALTEPVQPHHQRIPYRNRRIISRIASVFHEARAS